MSHGNGAPAVTREEFEEANSHIRQLKQMHGQLEKLFGDGTQRANQLQIALDRNSDALFSLRQEVKSGFDRLEKQLQQVLKRKG